MTTIDNTLTSPIQTEQPSILHRSLILMKPITWFGPMWAFLCGAIASGETTWAIGDIGLITIGLVMAGPMLCGFSQVINDYFDREVDAINEPDRLIPSGLVSTRQVFITLAVLLLSGLLLGSYFGLGVLLLVSAGVVLALFYSAPPIRAKRNGWVGNALVAISYEGLAWLAGHLVFASLTYPSIVVALLYSFGTHGIMSINDYKSMAGDKTVGIRSIPVLYGPQKAAWLIIATMNFAQIGVIGALFYWGLWQAGLILLGILLVQLPQQRKFLQQPVAYHLKFSAIGVSFFVWGMMVAAVGLRALS